MFLQNFIVICKTWSIESIVDKQLMALQNDNHIFCLKLQLLSITMYRTFTQQENKLIRHGDNGVPCSYVLAAHL